MESAVQVSNASKSYGSGKKDTLVLNRLNMTIPKGSIYGLLGASGCGKTTLLSCIAGRLSLNEGELKVLGGVPGTKGSGVPGPRIGYMPQDVALVNEMSVKNTIYYFGWMFAMTQNQIAARLDFLANLLELPHVDKLVKDLSGGQQRRVSFAAALVQTPELLILDEPTVGLDPVLRQSIWDYLVRVSRESAMTVIITTHYIEEATQADKVGLLREGRLLAEEAPDRLITRYRCETLEQVFLKLSQQQNQGHLIDPCPEQDCIAEIEEGASVDRRRVVFVENPRVDRPTPTFKNRLKALLYKDFLSFFRNTSGLAFMFLFPFIQITVFFLAVGNDAYGINIGVVNAETANCSGMLADLRRTSGVVIDNSEVYDNCHFYGLSCLLLDKLDDGTSINVYYNDMESAMAAAKKLYTSGVIYIPSNFSQLLEQRRNDPAKISDEAVDLGVIQVNLDMADYLVGYQLKKHIYDKYADLMSEVSAGCNISKKELKIPMMFEDPVYGNDESTYRDFMGPGIINTIAFFLSAMITGTILTTDRFNGVWDRNSVAGVSTGEVLLSHCLCQTTAMIIQVTEILLIAFYVFGMSNQGNVVNVIMLVSLQYITGLTYGLLVSALSKNTTEAIYFVVGSFIPIIFLNGSLWPLESAPRFLQYISFCAPGTWPTIALFNVLTRGWSLLHPFVWPGYALALAWIVGQFWVTMKLLSK